MNHRSSRLLSLLLALLLLLSACRGGNGAFDETTALEPLSSTSMTDTTDAPSTTEYPLGEFPEAELPTYSLTEEDIERAKTMIAHCEELSLGTIPLEEVEAAFEELDALLYRIEEQVTVANILYYADMTDVEASDRYTEAVSMIGELQVQYNAACRRIYRETTDERRDVLFAEWSEEELLLLERYTPEATEIEEANLALYMEQQALPEHHFNDGTASLYAEFVTAYNRLAEIYGYDNYYEYATRNVYSRDYGKTEREAFRLAVAETLVPILSELSSRLDARLSALSEYEMTMLASLLYTDYNDLGTNYLLNYFVSCDASMREGLLHALRNGNAYFSSDENAYEGAFQVDRPTTGAPFCFFGPGYQDTFTVSHELGHYYAALYSEDERDRTMDLLESHSQSNEMLLLAYLESKLPSKVYHALRDYRMINFLSVILVATVVDDFEEQVYTSGDVSAYTSAEFDALMREVCEKYGGYAYINTNLTDMNTYWRLVVLQSPVYYISYATSGMVAVSMLGLAEEDAENARSRYRVLVEETTFEDRFLGALSKAEMGNPFDPLFVVGVRRVMLGEPSDATAKAA